MTTEALQKAIPGKEDIIRHKLPNGIVVLVRENRSARSVVLTGAVMSGSILEPFEKNGLAFFTATSLLRGTRKRDFNIINETLESLGASLNLTATTSTISFGGKSLGEDLPVLLDVLSDALRHPAFPENQVERLRGELLTRFNIRRQNTRYMASRAFRQQAYPVDHPYHYDNAGEAETVQKITLDDLRHYHQQNVGPQGMIIVIAGYIKATEAIQLVEDYLGDWQNPSQPEMPSLAGVQQPEQAVYETVTVPGKSQSDIVIGVPGPPRLAPDFQAARLANHIFGVFGMYGRLGKNIREAQGLAYYAYSNLRGGTGPGPWKIIAGVDPANVQKAIDGIQDELNRMLSTPVRAEELEDSQMNMTGTLPLTLESNEGMAGAIYNMERFNLGLNYLKGYRETIFALNAEQVQAAMQNYWSSDNLIMTVAGPDTSATTE